MSNNYKEKYKGCIDACIPLQYSRVVVDEVIGRGKSCVAFKVHDLFNYHKQYALKIYSPIDKSEHVSPFLVGDWKREINILTKVSNSNLTPFIEEYGVTSINGYKLKYILMEYINGQTIQHLLKYNNLGLHERREIINKVFSTSIKLSDMGIWHVTGRTGNYILTQDNQVKFIDFGSSYTISNDIKDAIGKLKKYEYNKRECMALGLLFYNLFFDLRYTNTNVIVSLVKACYDKKTLPYIVYLAMKGGFHNINEFAEKVNTCLDGKKVF